MEELKNKILKLISENKTEKAIKVLMVEVDNNSYPEVYSQIVLLSSRYSSLKERKIKGVIEDTELSILQSRINDAILGFLKELKEGKLEEEAIATLIGKDELAKKKRKEAAAIANIIGDVEREQPIQMVTSSPPKSNSNLKYALLGFALIAISFIAFNIMGNENTIVSEDIPKKEIITTKGKDPEVVKIDGIEVPSYVICDNVYDSEARAKKRVIELNRFGYNNQSGYIWIPNFKSLSGAKKYLVFIGPFKEKREGIKAICQFKRKMKARNVYGVKLNNNSIREEFRCGD